ncbi:ATP-binding cassette domain-containing protein [Halorubellus sp. JP-L1]|uniref:ABC transporter ATP-binding protein n=1 Tax=Halorubellus sp. JP-L1 TaxID=2715753 RepID=UPI00140CAC2A|nr:oligopeptide/dipeptide ABC transporter ATP-binding protein [Halorubellus sp. JP-L1]NHN42921.1 ATP-binding cassette domain-containing protein [Halorubellus sp. JP-L1]
MSDPLLEVRGLEKYFEEDTGLVDRLLGRENQTVQAVDGVTFSLSENESKAVIGESGCGKTTLLRTLVGLYEPTAGELRFRGRDVSEFDKQDWKDFRNDVQIIFQDPFNSLDPKLTVEETLREPLLVHDMDRQDERIWDVCERVELNPPDQYLDRLPKQLSGGEKQRVSIARALIVEPDVLLADEPVSMLDVSTQASVLNLLGDLREELGVAMLYISHDLSTVSYVCDEIKVMYLGRVVEQGPTKQLLDDPKHPYARSLIRAIPIPDPNHHRERTTIDGTPPNPVDLGDGCRFRDRCPKRMEVCEKTPRMVDAGDGLETACHLYYEHGDDDDSNASPDAADSTPEVL